MVKEIKMYTVICDNCGCNAFDNSDYSCWQDKKTAVDMAVSDEDWFEDDDCIKHYCPKCITFVDDYNEDYIIDELRKDKYRKEVNNG